MMKKEIPEHETELINHIGFITSLGSHDPRELEMIKNQPMIIKDGDSQKVIKTYSAPEGGWTCLNIEAHAEVRCFIADAYIGDEWIGSTEL